MGRDVDEIRRNPTHLLVQLKDCGLVHTGSTAWRAKCPVHQGAALSFGVFRTREGEFLWNCFACGEKGDAIKLVMLLDGLQRGDAIRSLIGGQYRERLYLWSKAQPKARKKGRERTKVTVAIPCEQWGCQARLETLADDLLCLADSHPAWDFDIQGLVHIWAWCPTHHRSARTGRPGLLVEPPASREGTQHQDAPTFRAPLSAAQEQSGSGPEPTAVGPQTW